MANFYNVSCFTSCRHNLCHILYQDHEPGYSPRTWSDALGPNIIICPRDYLSSSDYFLQFLFNIQGLFYLLWVSKRLKITIKLSLWRNLCTYFVDNYKQFDIQLKYWLKIRFYANFQPWEANTNNPVKRLFCAIWVDCFGSFIL